MARRNATATVGLEDENARPLNQFSMPTGDTKGAPAQAFHNWQAIEYNAVTAKMLEEQDCEKQQAAALAVGRSARLGASAESSRPLGRLEVFDDSIYCDGDPQPPTTDTDSARPPSPLAPICVAVKATPVNAIATAVSPACDKEREQSAVVLDTSSDTVDTICYTDLRELESDVAYAHYIYCYMRKQELEYAPTPKYMQTQPDITSSMRTILIDWLVEVADHYDLHAETLFRAVSYMDRFLSRVSVLRYKLQLLGTAALLIAAKFEEVYPPKVEEFIRINHGAYSKRQVFRMEEMVLKILSFDVSTPTINYFLLRFAEVDNATVKVRHLARYLCEMALLDDDPYLNYLPSITAGSSLCLANHMLGRRPWGEELVEYSGYEMTSFRDCIQSLYCSFCNAPTRAQQAVHGKFKDEKFQRVANLKPIPTLPF